jgi:hypothetical protein
VGVCAKVRRRFDPSMMFDPMPLLVSFFAVTMGVNHRKDKDNQATNHQDDDDRFILPYIADKFGHIRIHAGQNYTMSVEKGNDFTNGRRGASNSALHLTGI